MTKLSSPLWLFFPLLVPLLFGACITVYPFRSKKAQKLYIMAIVMITSLLTLGINWLSPEGTLTLLGGGAKLSLAFRADGLSKVFSTMVAVLWPLATLYAFEYMSAEERITRFYTFYTITYGVTLAIAYAANFLTMYLFYELLTLVTLPLVIHAMDRQAFAAGKRYIFYSIGGATLVFVCLVFIATYGETISFQMGGVFSSAMLERHGSTLLQAFTLAFIGFGVKAAVFPLHGWLPAASVAPTTVTALLHAVAVVKSAAFAAMRLTYYIFGADFLSGTWAQQVIMAFCLITILFGSARAWYTTHFKRRLVYSTISQLSYILFGIALMTPMGLAAALMYMVAHGFIKILLFYCCGAVHHQTHREDISEVEGLGRYMPVTFATFTIAALSLMGLPPTVGFVAKLQLLTAIGQSGRALALFGIVVVLASILLTAAYLFSIIRAAYFPRADGPPFDPQQPPTDPKPCMTIPLQILAFLILAIGICSQPLLDWLTLVSQGLR